MSEKKEATLIFVITSPSVEIFLPFLKRLDQDKFLHDVVCILTTGVRPLPGIMT